MQDVPPTYSPVICVPKLYNGKKVKVTIKDVHRCGLQYLSNRTIGVTGSVNMHKKIKNT